VALSNLASIEYSLKHYPEAEALYRRQLELSARVLPAGHIDILAGMSGLGLVCLELGKTDEARQLLEGAREGFKSLPDDHSWSLLVKRNLAMVYRRENRLGEAEALLEEAMQDTIRTQGEDHADVRGLLNNLASVYEQGRRYEEAEALYLDAWERAIDDLGRESPETVTFLKNLMLCYVKDGRFEEAEPLARELVERLPEGSGDRAAAQRGLRQILNELGK
jgi:tetratricopeptide (TPR) repeat protein